MTVWTTVHRAWIYYWVGRKKSEFFKNGFKPLLLTSQGTHNSNFILGLIFGPILDRFWAQKAKKRPSVFFKNVDFLLLFHSNVMRNFKVYNWCFGLFKHSLWLSGVFKNQIFLFGPTFGPIFGPIWGQFWAKKAKKTCDFFFQNLIFYYFWLVLE